MIKFYTKPFITNTMLNGKYIPFSSALNDSDSLNHSDILTIPHLMIQIYQTAPQTFMFSRFTSHIHHRDSVLHLKTLIIIIFLNS